MLRAALLCLGLLAVTWLEFQVFPGHTYLDSGTQFYVPALQRLNAPGYLSRDLLSQTPDVLSYTIYDEVTLFLHSVCRLTFQQALQGQQLLFRLAGLVGIFLLARSTGLTDLFSLLLAALVNLGAVLAGPDISMIDREPVPAAFALGLILLAMGLFAREKPLLSGFSAGVALCYDPVLAAPFWIVVLVAFVCDGETRKPIRPMAPILLVFILLLANMAQLQPGVAAEGPGLFSKVSPQLAELQQFRTPSVWVSVWAAKELWHYLAVMTLGLWAAARIWPVLNRYMRWLVAGIGVAGLAGVPFSYLLLDRLRYAVVAEWQPSKVLVLTMALSALLFGLAGMRAILLRTPWEAFAWFALLFAVSADSSVLPLLPVFDGRQILDLVYYAVFAGALTWLLLRFRGSRWRFSALLVPVGAVFALLYLHGSNPNGSDPDRKPQEMAQIHELAAWADRNTWGSSMFLFPDAAKMMGPAIFRAQSRRAVWADWASGAVADYSETNGLEWLSRWRMTMEGRFSPARLQGFLALPVDYYVLKRRHQIAGVRAVFTNQDFTVYDAQDLRNAPGELRLAH
jgi:hypothetical protein